jgi:hypothetical protein
MIRATIAIRNTSIASISPTARALPAVRKQRFAAAEVLIYDAIMPYRPKPLRDHEQVKHYYQKP